MTSHQAVVSCLLVRPPIAVLMVSVKACLNPWHPVRMIRPGFLAAVGRLLAADPSAKDLLRRAHSAILNAMHHLRHSMAASQTEWGQATPGRPRAGRPLKSMRKRRSMTGAAAAVSPRGYACSICMLYLLPCRPLPVSSMHQMHAMPAIAPHSFHPCSLIKMMPARPRGIWPLAARLAGVLNTHRPRDAGVGGPLGSGHPAQQGRLLGAV